MMRKAFLGIMVLVCLLPVIMGCASVTPTLKKDYKPNGEEGFIYGRFKMIQSVSKNYIGLVIENDVGGKYTIKLSPDSVGQYQIIAVVPGKYKITQKIYIYTAGDIAGSEAFVSPENYSAEFTIEKGDAIYIGDFVGETALTQMSMASKTFNFKLNLADNNQEVTNTRMISSYPFFSKLNIKTVFN